jgi:UDP-N-acetylglucosamine--N-acetylmuramyl-(pentapeptide) pyrophosphoryl-undecaprenol N-acetylglucosamine transferase
MPAFAVIKAIRELAKSSADSGDAWAPDFLYAGSENGVERRLSAEAGVAFESVKTGKLRRAANPVKMINRANIADLFRIPVGLAQAFSLVSRFHPHVLFSTGGYVSVPAALAASMRGIPVVAHEQTVQIGLANKIIMNRASVIALSFPESQFELPERLRSRVTVTGNPVREGLFGGDPNRGAQWAGFADEPIPCLYVTGGAQGSRMVNMAVRDALGELLQYCRIIHQCGRQPGESQDIDALNAAAADLPDALKRRYFATQFVADELADVFALADLVVGRSGAGTVTEICALGKAAIFIPLVPTGGDEQTRNARRLESIGAAVILKQADLSGSSLFDKVRELAQNPLALADMEKKASSLAMPNAAADIARLVAGAQRRHGRLPLAHR